MGGMVVNAGLQVQPFEAGVTIINRFSRFIDLNVTFVYLRMANDTVVPGKPGVF
jgi:hypothetical protein